MLGANTVAAAQAAEQKEFEGWMGFYSGLEAILEGVGLEIVSTLYSADVGGQDLDDKVQEIMAQHSRGYHDLIAIAVFNGLMNAIYRLPMKPVIGGAFTHAGQFMYDRGIVNMEHWNLPKASQATLTLGVLMILAPSIVHRLGIADQGILRESWADSWEINYGEVVHILALRRFIRDVGERGPLNQTATGSKRRRVD